MYEVTRFYLNEMPMNSSGWGRGEILGRGLFIFLFPIG